MGDNAAYTHMEASVIAAYNAGLRGEQFAPFLEPYRGSDIDEGGRRDILTNDGKGIEEVIIEAFGTPEQLATWKSWLDDNGRNDELYDAAQDALDAIIGRDGRFGWC